MKAINIKLATFTFAAMLLASCSDSSNEITGGGETAGVKTIVGEEITSVTDAQELAKSVINYKAVAGSRSRATSATEADLVNVYSMPAQPSAEGAIELTEENSCVNLDASKKYIIKGKVSSNLNLNGATIFVQGVLSTTNIWGGSAWINNAAQKGKIIILPGGTLNINNNNTALFQNAGIYCYNYGGTLHKDGKNMYIESGDAYYTTGSIKVDNELKIQGRLYVGENATVGKLSTESGAQINIQGNLNGTENQDMSVDGCLLNIGGKAKFNKLTIGGSGPKFFGCSVEVAGTTRIDSNGAEAHFNNLKTNDIYQCAGSTFYLVNNSIIDCAGTYQVENNGHPQWGGSSKVILLGDNANATFRASEVKYNGDNDKGYVQLDSGKWGYISTCYIFQCEGSGGVIYMDCDKFTNNGSTATYTYAPGLSDNTKRYIAEECPVVATSCDGTPTPPPTTPEEPKKKIDIISVIDYTGHSHDISATCIRPYNGKLYMSYHTNEENQTNPENKIGGCIEVFETKNDQTTMLQYLQDKKQLYDFNHLLVDDKDATKYVYLAGHSNNGGMFARIALDDNGLLNTQVKEINDTTAENPLTVIEWKSAGEAKSDENCIVRDGNKLIVACTKGYGVYDATTLKELGKKETPGKAKHIAINDNTIATLHYNNPVSTDNEEVKATVQEFATGSDLLTATPSKTIAIDGIAPNDGKNTIAIDGNYIYVCRSAKGLSCYDRTTGAEVWNWGAPLTATTRVPQGYANGVTYDENYIYLACGGYGLVILDKNKKDTSGKPVVVAKKRSEAFMSANYVTVYNGYIYVAYGKSRLRVMKLIDGNASSGNTSYDQKK